MALTSRQLAKQASFRTNTGANKASADVVAPTSKPDYNAKTGATTGTPSPEYDAYLKSLNKLGSPNYVRTPETDKELQNLADTSPEQADNVMDKMGYTGSPNLTPGITKNPDGTISYSGVAGTSVFNPKTGTSKFQQAFQQLKGTQAPSDAGQGKMEAKGIVDSFNQNLTVSPLGGIMEVDTNFDSIFTNLDKYMEPLNQKKSLLQEYQSLSKELGIPRMNEELIDAKRIIEGTEDDIRAEVTAAGGFASDSQVLALANARNKSLIKNYNVLLESRDNAMQQLDTMMDLTVEDRKAAENEFDRKMNFAFKIADFQQKAAENARSGLKWAIENGGGAEILKSPYETQLTERTLRLPPGSLAGIVAQQAQKDLQFVSGTETQPMGYFNKTTGKFTQLGGGVGGTVKDAKTEQKKQNTLLQANTVIGKVDEALNQLTGMNVGLLGGLTKDIPGTSAYNLNRTIDTIKSNVGFQALQQMREASPTGGALGQVAVQELSMLQSTISSLDIGQGKKQLSKNLKEVKQRFENVTAIILAGQEGKEVTYDDQGNIIILEN